MAWPKRRPFLDVVPDGHVPREVFLGVLNGLLLGFAESGELRHVRHDKHESHPTTRDGGWRNDVGIRLEGPTRLRWAMGHVQGLRETAWLKAGWAIQRPQSSIKRYRRRYHL